MECIRRTIFVQQRLHYVTINAAVDVLFSWVSSLRQTFGHILTIAQKNMPGTSWEYGIRNTACCEGLERERTGCIIAHFNLSCVSESTDRFCFVGGNSPHKLT